MVFTARKHELDGAHASTHSAGDPGPRDRPTGRTRARAGRTQPHRGNVQNGGRGQGGRDPVGFFTLSLSLSFFWTFFPLCFEALTNVSVETKRDF